MAGNLISKITRKTFFKIFHLLQMTFSTVLLKNDLLSDQKVSLQRKIPGETWLTKFETFLFDFGSWEWLLGRQKSLNFTPKISSSLKWFQDNVIRCWKLMKNIFFCCQVSSLHSRRRQWNGKGKKRNKIFSTRNNAKFSLS